MQRENNDIVVGNDIFSQFLMLYFAAGGIVAISDSVFVLTELRRHLGIPNRVNTDAALSRAWIHGMASQCLGTSTLFDGVQYCPPGSKIRVNLAGDKPAWRLEKVSAPELFSSDISDYRSAIVQGAERAASVIATVLQIPGAKTSLSLSGGLDSRVCLAAALMCDNRDALFFRTITARQDEYAVAMALAQRFDFDFKNPPNPSRKDAVPKEQIPSWFLSCAGIYDPLSGGGGAGSDHFGVNGGGAEIYKGNFGWRPLSAIRPDRVGYVSAIRPAIARYKAASKRDKGGLRSVVPDCPRTLIGILRLLKNKSRTPPKVEEDIADAAYRESSRGLSAIGVPVDDLWGTEWHYLCFRNAIHFGRSTMALSPLLQPDLVGTSRSGLNEYPAPRLGSPSIVTDLLIALDPELALMPFDDPQKNMDAGYVEERARFLGRVANVEPYEIAGDPSAVNSGTPKMFLTLVAARNYEGKFSPEAVKKLVREGFENIPQDVRHAYHIPRYLVENELPERISASSWECIAAGKIMAFLLADNSI
jgi:hypothetical protein